MYFINNSKMFLDRYTSISDDSTKTKVISKEINVCLNISIFIFSLLLSFIIELWSFIPLTAKASTHGINKIFWRSSVDIKNKVPFPYSKT